MKMDHLSKKNGTVLLIRLQTEGNMAVEKVSFYTVRCDKCNCLLEDYTGELARITWNKAIAESIAKENGFIQISPRKWLCSSCVKTL